MHDFVPEDMNTFLVGGQSAEVFYENISHTTPTLIRGAYYIHGGADAKPISVVVQDPVKNIIYKRSDEIQGIILFNTTEPGEYTFIFANFDDSAEKTCTLAIHTYDADEEPISYDFDANGVRIVKYDPKNPNGEADKNVENSEDDVAGDEEIGNLRTLLRTI